MNKTTMLWILCCAAAIPVMSSGPAYAQRSGEEEIRDGYYEITLKTPDSKKIIVDELVRDTDLNPEAFYRVTTSGYMAFDESAWVDKIEFKVFDRPVTELDEYRGFADVLSKINDKLSAMHLYLRQYNQMSFRLMNMCDKSLFPNLRSIDENIADQLSVYKQFLLLREVVVNSVGRFVRERSCVDRYAKYKSELSIYTKRLTELCKEYERIKGKAVALSRQQKAEAESEDAPAEAPKATK